MTLKVFTIYDAAVKAYMTPFFAKTSGEAIRMWEDTVNDEKTQFYKHAKDFTLFEIAEYDDQSGSFKQLEANRPLGVAVEFIRENK